jgi:disulfide bond formation protein DsbB
MFLRLVAFAFPPNQLGRALWTLFVALATLATVWILQSVGYRPCELCLTERIAFYVGAPLAALTAFAAYRGAAVPVRLGLAALALCFLANAVLAGYHTGVEYHFWEGPTACTGAMTKPIDVTEMLKQIQTAQAPRCDDPAMRILGVSLAGWDFVVSAALGLYAALAATLKR